MTIKITIPQPGGLELGHREWQSGEHQGEVRYELGSELWLAVHGCWGDSSYPFHTGAGDSPSNAVKALLAL